MTRDPTGRTTPRADAAQRAATAWNARVLGGSWEQAAQVAGFTDTSNCIRAVRRAYGTVPEPERDELRRIWRDRIEYLWRQTTKDVSEQRPGAVTAGVRVAGAAAALDGLNQPVEVVLSPSHAELEAWVERVRAAQVPVVVEYDIIRGGPR